MGIVGIGAALAILGGKFKGFGMQKKLAWGMTALGAGLAGFFTGILLGEKGLEWIKEASGVDGTGLGKLMKTFLGSFDTAASAGALFGILVAGAATGFGKGSAGKIVLGMTALGAGLVGFFGGMILAEKGAEWALGDLLKAPPGENMAKLMKSFMASFKDVGAEGLTALGLLLAAGAVIGMKKGISGGVAVAVGMTGIGMGLAGFFGGLALAEAGIKGLEKWTGVSVEGETLSKLMKNFMGAFAGVSVEGLAALGTLLAAGATMGALLSIKTLGKVAIGMTALGLGIAGFFGGLSLAETLMTKVADWTGGKVTDGSVLSTFMGHFTKALENMTEKSLKVLGGLLVAGAVIGGLLGPGGAAKVAIGMTALGASIGGFFAGLSLADFVLSKVGTGENLAAMMGNLGKGIGDFVGNMASGAIQGFMELDADKLGQIGAGIRDLGIGMLAFAGGTIGGAAGGVMEKVAGWFGSESPLEKIKGFADSVNISDAKKLTIIGKAIRDLGEGMAAFAGVESSAVAKSVDAMGKVAGIDLGKVSESLMKSDESKVPSTEDPKGEGEWKMQGTPGNKKKVWVPKAHQGGLISEGGVYRLLPKEMVLDNQAVAALAQALTMVTMSQENAMAGGGNTTIISAPTQPITNLAQNSTNINQINVPESAVNNERTFRTVAHGQMARA